MVAKTRIIDELGEDALLLPELVNRALAANDRAKYYFTLLQNAEQHADDPDAPFSDLATERRAGGVDDVALDEVVGASRRDAQGGCRIPRAEALHDAIEQAVAEMLAPATVDGDAQGFGARFERLRGGERPRDDHLPPGYVARLTHAERQRGDSLHLLVMDLHKRLNAMQAALASESVDGARAYAIDDADRPLVAAFMRGLNATAPLKFDHPGLGTTATRSGDTLVIQNDIGTTDAHVLVIHVRGRSVTITYTDLHPRRARFFTGLFEAAGVDWERTRTRSAEGLAESDGYLLCTGHAVADDDADLARRLAFIGSRLVFLIDWNKARKRLRRFVRQRDAVELLRYAADNDLGHRAFLELGGERLVYETLQAAGTVAVNYGDRLDRVLGRDTVMEHLRFVLRTTSQGLRHKRSARLIRDEIKADLLERLHTAEQSLFELLGDHATLCTELAAAVCEGLADAPLAGTEERLAVVAERAKNWETRADELVMQVRERVRHSAERGDYERLAHVADDVADQLEEAAFLLPLLPCVQTPAPLYAPLASLARLVLDGTRALVSALETARHVQRGGAREDLHDFLEAVDRMLTVEHRTDEAEREVTSSLITAGAEHRQLHLLSLLGRRLERSADATCRSALMLRDRVMAQVTQA